jgi:membrane-associated phospholipid phosphatase
MARTSRETERDNSDESRKSARERENEPVERIEEEAKEAVQEAREDVARVRAPWYRQIRRGYILVGVYSVLLVLFALLATFVHFHPVLGVDVSITKEFQENQAPWLNWLMTAVSYIGYQNWLSVGLVVVAAVILWLVDLRLEAVTVAVVYAISGLLNAVIKVLVARPRPSASLVDVFRAAGGESFPSGHVMSYVAFWGLLFTFGVILFDGWRWWRIALLVVSAFFVMMVGPSRIYLGAHWASDVLGAYLIEVALLGIALLIYLQLDQRGVLSPRKAHKWFSAKKLARGKQRLAAK